MARRIEALREACRTTASLRGEESLDYLLRHPLTLRNFIYNDEHQLIYCYVPKASRIVSYRIVLYRFVSLRVPALSGLCWATTYELERQPIPGTAVPVPGFEAGTSRLSGDHATN